MNRTRMIAAALLSGSLLVACGGDEKTPAETPTKAPPAKVETPKPETPAEAPKPETPGAATDVVAEAKQMLADAMAKLSGKNPDEAKSILDKLVGMKAQLPADLQKQIDDAVAALKAKSALGGLIPK